ncbi:class I SAM-dependent methyltransferase [Sphingobium sp. MK2]|uniref:class I SAM-dependent methyltransferase n=1 Tax=Sphingobium sp. MK2 TaxID=3116540 RepID=UPI0032E35B5D
MATRVLATHADPLIAEVGIGIGATSLALARAMDHRGTLWLFDFDSRVQELRADLADIGYRNVEIVGNSRRTFDSYGWTLAMLTRRARIDRPEGMFDFIYLDGGHLYQYDTLAAICCKELLKPGGYLLLDDYDWTIAKSPTMRPSHNPSVLADYSEEQIELSHVEMICSLLLDPDAGFEQIPLGYRDVEHRRAYLKL